MTNTKELGLDSEVHDREDQAIKALLLDRGLVVLTALVELDQGLGVHAVLSLHICMDQKKARKKVIMGKTSIKMVVRVKRACTDHPLVVLDLEDHEDPAQVDRGA